MKKYAFLIILLAGLFSSCTKEKQVNHPNSNGIPNVNGNGSVDTCYISVYYGRPVGIAFVGFSPEALDTIYVTHYKGGTNFDTLLSKDTIICSDSNMLIYHDTILYANYNTLNYSGFWHLSGGVDDSVFVPATGTSFAISGTQSGHTFNVYISDGDCGGGGQIVEPLRNIHIDGTPVSATVTENSSIGMNAFIYLKK